ncbi:heavy-metal-associated domain-containing protein [Methanogenium marinum]|uniref:Heavy-metal-associated domain-containing protein n=1 Tax=Methanogenium marinum TaxID=348610 RepID=A0A9Q4KT82_9EURY|nr:heavy metal-associated domain-containing protein [Methanogenium marinum]MDE4907537.1 heavy-metal-associated domain-containing protein [Methanogenium marinum]
MTEQKQNTIIRLPVTGMMCDGCVAAVKAALESVPGVKNADVSLEKKEAAVTYDPAQATTDEMKTAVENAGYGIKI